MFSLDKVVLILRLFRAENISDANCNRNYRNRIKQYKILAEHQSFRMHRAERQIEKIIDNYRSDARTVRRAARYQPQNKMNNK